MKTFGALLCVAAVIALGIGFSLDTSVPTGLGGRVNNLGLMKDQQNLILLGGALLIAGALLVVLSGRGDSQTVPGESEYRKCPSCAEQVRSEALICRYCQQPLPSLAEIEGEAKAERDQLAEARARDPSAARLIEEKLPKGLCPNCDKEIPLSSLECKYCPAQFVMEGGWRVLPMPPDKQENGQHAA